jgi:hypothetical protein
MYSARNTFWSSVPTEKYWYFLFHTRHYVGYVYIFIFEGKFQIYILHFTSLLPTDSLDHTVTQIQKIPIIIKTVIIIDIIDNKV